VGILKHKTDAPAGATHASPLRAEDTSVALQHYLEAETQRRNIPDPVAPADFLNMLLSSRANVQVGSEHKIEGEHEVHPYVGCEIPSDRDFLDRIAQVAYERYTARRVAQDVPTMVIVPARLTKREANDLLGGRLNYVMIFGAESIYFQDTVHTLAVDSGGIRVRAACDCPRGVNVLGVHMNWISSDGESVERALAVDETGLVKEVAFREPVPIHIVQILHLPLKRERELHRELSAHFRDRGIPQVNPYEGSSERADDKAQAHALWDKCGREIICPKYILIPRRSSSEEIVNCLRFFVGKTRKPDVVVQPNGGTEGYKVREFSGIAAERITSSLPIVKYIEEQVLSEDDALVRERRGNVRYKGTSCRAPTFLNVAFRINVAWNGSEFVAESGYAQIAKDERTFPASRGRGGTIVDINETLASLYYHRGNRWVRFIPTDEDTATMKGAAINAAYGLNAGLDVEDYLKHMGIDILLEVKELEANSVNVTPVVLEANPRPAGLSHSSEIVGISGKKPQSRISTEIFRFVESMGL